MKALINADELANDVAGAEALLDRHQEHKVKSPITHQGAASLNWICFLVCSFKSWTLAFTAHVNQTKQFDNINKCFYFVFIRERLMPMRTVSGPLMKLARPYSIQDTMPLTRSRKRYAYDSIQTVLIVILYYCIFTCTLPFTMFIKVCRIVFFSWASLQRRRSLCWICGRFVGSSMSSVWTCSSSTGTLSKLTTGWANKR